MSLGYAEGAALGVMAADNYRNQLRNGRLSNEISALEARNRELEEENRKLREALESWKKAHSEERSQNIENSRVASAGLIVMNGMILAMRNFPILIAEKFRTEVVAYSQNRFRELDKAAIEKGKQNGYVPLTIEKAFSTEPEYKKLGFDR